MTEQEFEWFVARRAEDLATIQRTERERDEARAAVLKLRKSYTKAWIENPRNPVNDLIDAVQEFMADTESYEQYR